MKMQNHGLLDTSLRAEPEAERWGAQERNMS